jgi:hypothetical protein
VLRGQLVPRSDKGIQDTPTSPLKKVWHAIR